MCVHSTPSPPHQPHGHRPQPWMGTAQPLHPLPSSPTGRGHRDPTCRDSTDTQYGTCSGKGWQGGRAGAGGTHLVPRAGRTAGGGSCTCRCYSKPRRKRRMSHPAGTHWLGSRVRHPCSIRGGRRIPLLPCRSFQLPLAAAGGERNISTEWQQRGQAGIAAASWYSLGP